MCMEYITSVFHKKSYYTQELHMKTWKFCSAHWLSRLRLESTSEDYFKKPRVPWPAVVFCWLGIWTLTETEVFVQLLDSAEPRAACSWPSLAPLCIREEGCGHLGLCSLCVEGEPRPWTGGCVSPCREVMPSHDAVVASLPTPLLRAGSCFVFAGSPSWTSEPPSPGSPLLRNLEPRCWQPADTMTCMWQREHFAKSIFNGNRQKNLPAWDITFESMSAWGRGKPRVWAVYFYGEWGLSF